MLKNLMQEWRCDAPDAMIKATELLIEKHSRIIQKFGFKWDKMINFFISKEAQYRQLYNEFIEEYWYAY